MKLFKYLLIASAFCATALAGDSTQVLKRIDQMEGSYSPINAVKIGLFEESTKGYATYADAAGPTPVNGTGGSPNVTFTRSTVTPLEGKASGLLTKDAANRQGQGVSYDFTLDKADSTNNPQNMVIDFYYETGGTFATGANSDVQIFIYDITNAALITPEVQYISSPAGRLQTTFLPSATSTSYRLIFHIATTSTSAWTLKLDRVSVHPLNATVSVTGAATTALLTTGNGFGSTNTNVRRYSSVTVSGSGITCADDATNGASCTIQEDGVWAFNRLDKNTGAASNFGISKNDACTSGFNSVTSSNQLAAAQSPSNVAVNAPNVGVSLVVGDIIRACDDSGNKTNDTTSQYSRLQVAKVRDAALPSSFIVATGGTITTDGNYKVHTFTTSGTFQITSGSGTVESLVVAGGGGGGGGNYGGGGGAGGVVYTTPGAVYGIGTYSVSVGTGGAGGGTGSSGSNGTGSAFDSISATAGGGGGYGNNPSSLNGANGGSGGGGGGGNSPGSNTTGGTGVAGQGFAGSGGNVNAAGVGGGGGGCSAAASASGTNLAGNGGNGCSYVISGSSVTYGGGGGGGANGVSGGTGGTGGGGSGNSSGNGANATGFGSGGGGAGGPTTFSGGAGSNGVVILRYQFQ